MKFKQKSVLSALILILAAGISSVSQAQVSINLAGANTTPIGQDKIRISSVVVSGQSYDVDLQWNPYDLKFDVVMSSVKPHSNPLECQITAFTSWNNNDATITLSQSASSNTIQAKLTSLANDAMTNIFSDYNYNFNGIIQNGRLLNWSKKAENLNVNTALITFEANYNGASGIPRGVTRTATFSNIPTWFDYNQPIQAIVFKNKTINCQ